MLALYELIELLPPTFQPSFAPRVNELYALLKKEKLEEASAAQKLLPPPVNLKYFNKLKNQLKQELINQIIVQPSVWCDTQQKKWYDHCQKNFASYRLLLASSRRIAAIDIAHKILPLAIKLELFELVFAIASDLEYHYSAIDLSRVKARKYAQIADQYLDLSQASHSVKRKYNKVIYLYNSKNSFTKTDIKLFKETMKSSLLLVQQKQSGQIKRLVYNIAIYYYYVIYDYQQILHYCDQALATSTQSHPSTSAFRFAFLQKKIPALIALGRFTEAKDIARKARKLVPKGSFNWHLILLQRVEACFHAGEYKEAYDLYKEQKKYSSTAAIIDQYWKVIRAYIHFLIGQGHIQPYSQDRFSLGKFLNEVPLYSRDKAGMNVNILLIQILIYLQRGQYGKIIDRVEALGAYARKHTRKLVTTRAHIFIQMIIKMESAGFHKSRTERKTQNLRNRLIHNPLRRGQSIAVELLPYSFLWDCVLQLISTPQKTKRQASIGARQDTQ